MSSERSPRKLLDATTFGNSKACLILVDMLNKQELTTGDTNNICRILKKYQGLLSELDVLPQKEWMATITRNHFLKCVDNLSIEEKYKSYTKNVLCYFYSRAHEKWNNK